MNLDENTSLKIVLASAPVLELQTAFHYFDRTGATDARGAQLGVSDNTSDATVVDPPDPTVVRTIALGTIHNPNATDSPALTIKLDDGSQTIVWKTTIPAGGTLQFVRGEWKENW